MRAIGEVVKQFEVYVPELSYPVKGKIVKEVRANGEIFYRWSISHHYKPAAGAGVYYPSTVDTRSLEETEMLFRAYAESFVSDFEVTPNEHF